ncbi:MAG: hypothetical protein H0T68_10525 [Gemmatimonadales bacterium]|nr:hypothetical protein [Gemmatimonadales bacterium]
MTAGQGGRGTGGLVGFLLLAAVMLGCQEDLTAPADCPELCPSGNAEVFDVILNPLPGSDSSYFPYVGPGAGPALLVSNGLPAAEARTVFRFVSRPDSIEVRDTLRAYTVDSVLLSVVLLARDTLTDGLKVFLYRLPPTVDDGISFAEVDPLLVEANIIDSILVPDSLNSGRLQTVLQAEELAKVALPLGTGGTLAVGVAIGAAQPTGIRLGSAVSGSGPNFLTYTTVDVPDTTTAIRKQQILRTPGFNTFLTATTVELDSTALTVGGAPSSRALLRFDLPEDIEDSATIVRATLELIPTEPILGLPTDPSTLAARAVLADLGAKSPVTEDTTFIAIDTLSPGTMDTVRLDVTRVVRLWQADSERPEAVFLSLLPEAATFMRAEFGSTRTPQIGAPRLRVTYLRPFPFENP